MWILVGVVSAGTLNMDMDGPGDLSASSPVMQSLSRRCYAQAFQSELSGRLELEIRAVDGQLETLAVSSNLGDQGITECFCDDTPAALREWLETTVGGESSLTLPFILAGSAGASPNSQHEVCELQGEIAQFDDSVEVDLPEGSITWKKIKVDGGLSEESVEEFLIAHQASLERCYRSDLVRWPEYSGTADVELFAAADGTVTGARIVGLDNNSTTNCQTMVLLESTFPAQASDSHISMKLRYTPE